MLVVKETYLSRRPERRSLWAALASLIVLLTMSSIYWSNALDLASLLPASREAVFHHQEYWRLMTSMTAHADFEHFLSNGIVLAVLSFLLFGYYGPVVYPLLSVGAGCLVTALSLRTYPAGTLLVGASGLVYLMAAFWLTMYLLIERRVGLTMRFVRAAGFGLIVLVPAAFEPQVSYRTHAIGFAAGVALALMYFSKKKDAIRAHERVELD